MRFLRGLYPLIAVLILVLPGCGESNNSGPSAGSETADQVLRVAFAEPIGVLNPQAFTGHFMALDMVYEPLVRYGPNGVALPALAESWDFNEDGTEVVFHLREDVKFHDGTEFNSEAAKWNLERWVGVPDYSFLQSSLLISKIETPDELTLVLTLDHPYGPLLGELSLNRPVRFLSPNSVDDKGQYQAPVGTGPWRVTAVSDTSGTFERFDDYWGEKPSFERVETKLIPDSQTRLSALRSGEVDLLGGGYMAPIGAVEAENIQQNAELELYRGAADTTLLLGFNPNSSLLDSEARTAINLAVDSEAISKVLYGDDAVTAAGLFPPSIPNALANMPAKFDLNQARATLDEAGWKLEGRGRVRDEHDLVLKMLLIGDAAHGQGDSRNAGQAIADSLSQIGITVTIESLDGPAYFDALTAGNYDLAFFNTYGAPYDPPGTVAAFLQSGGGEAPIWIDDVLENLVAQALSNSDEANEAVAYAAIFDHLVEAKALVPITHPPRYYATASRVVDFVIPPSEYEFPWRGLALRP